MRVIKARTRYVIRTRLMNSHLSATICLSATTTRYRLLLQADTHYVYDISG
jgi:mRNA-degrading endonuclease toxin of MazEF toxin-antitoxin module